LADAPEAPEARDKPPPLVTQEILVVAAA